MTKYLLMYSQEREMSIRGVFDTPEEARAAMNEEFRNYHLNDCKIDEEDFLDGLENYDEYSIDETSAWSNANTNLNVDWKIERIEIETVRMTD